MLRVFKNTKPAQKWLSVYVKSYAENTEYYAYLNEDGSGTILKSAEGGRILGPHRTIKALQKKTMPGKYFPTDVYSDSNTGKSVVIRTEMGLLWLG